MAMSIDAALNGLLKVAIAAAVVVAGALALMTVLDRQALDRKVAERRALVQRNADLSLSAVAPGSALACLDGVAGDAIENACEKAVFASPQSAAAAVAYTAARLALLADAQIYALSDPGFPETFAPARRAVELDRYGLAAHVLASRDGCTAERCAAFSWLRDTAALKGNLKAQAFEGYVTHYAAAWAKPDADKQTPVASTAPPAMASVPDLPGHPMSSKYDFPSSASIPPVSIMNAEPPPPAAPGSAAAANAAVPSPPKRPQAQAAPPPTQTR
jgi:hypothetical protein